MNTRKMSSAILVAVVALFLGACGTSTTTPDANSDDGNVAATATVTQVFVPTSPTTYPSPITPVVLADCFLSFQVAAWQDLDGDGLWGASEPPLEGVEFRLQGIFAQIWGYPYLSEADGRLTITTWSPGNCTERDYTITAVPPESYEPTTPASVTFSLTSVDFSYEAQFGFRAVSK